MQSESEKKLDQLFLEAFETNHPAMHDWVKVKFELKELRAKLNSGCKHERETVENKVPIHCGCWKCKHCGQWFPTETGD